MERGNEVWHNGWNGPRLVMFIETFDDSRPTSNKKDKAVILFHNLPEVVDNDDLYAGKAECFRSYGIRKQNEAMAAMNDAQRWLVHADTAEQEALAEAREAATDGT